MDVVVLGCGYTGERVARQMIGRGARVICTSRQEGKARRLDGAEWIPLDVARRFTLDFVPAGSVVLHSIPPLECDDPQAIVRALGSRPARVVYLSTTGVYGDQRDVDASTPPAPRHLRHVQRLAAEAAVCAGPWSSIVLRPAAIYGPDRGVHVSMAKGEFRLVDGGRNYVSRIHVDDLAAHVEAAFESRLTGVWPVADEEPCTAVEIADFCSELMGLPRPENAPASHDLRRADRRVDGREVRAQLGIELQYPSYRVGIPASSK